MFLKRISLFYVFYMLLEMTYVQAFTVVIDPGHGGIFPGAICRSPKLQEKDINLAVALKLYDILKESGITMVLTRTRDMHFDTDLLTDLRKRVAFGQQHNPDLFISIHCNNEFQGVARGFELYVPMSKIFPQESYSAACYIHHAMVHACKKHFCGILGNINLYDRGIHEARCNVLMLNDCPSVIVELDYLSNKKIAQKMLTQAWIDSMAQIVADGIKAYVASKKSDHLCKRNNETTITATASAIK